MATFGETLKRLRNANGLSQVALAKAASISKSALIRLELDQATASWPTVVALAGALGVQTDEFKESPAKAAKAPSKKAPRT